MRQDKTVAVSDATHRTAAPGRTQHLGDAAPPTDDEEVVNEPGTRLDVRGVTVTYGAFAALSDVSFDVRAGEVHALLGHNGAGKSTLVKVLSGLVQPDSGEVLIDGEHVQARNPRQSQMHGVALVDQELSLVPTLTVAENMMLGAARSSSVPPARLREILDSLGLERVALGAPVSSLSLGEQQLVEIARALSRDAKILILDEPTATLSDHEIDMVFAAVRAMAADGRSIIYVSHRLGEILALCQRATVLRDGRTIGTESVATLDRDSIVTMMLGHLPESGATDRAPDPSRSTVLSVTGLSVPPSVHGVDLEVAEGQIIGIAGQVGCGASEIMRALAGLEPLATGQVEVAGRPLRLTSPLTAAARGIFYTTSDRKQEGLFLTHSIARNVVATRLPLLSRWGLVRRASDRRAVGELLGLTDIAPDRSGHPVGSLSGGNQQKVLVARSLRRPSSVVLLFDEPTRGVDVGGRAEIHDLIRAAAADGKGVVFCSTELDEVMELSDTVVTMFGGRVVSVRSRADVTAARVLTDMTHGRVEEEVA
ncbi:sugar ABC transporter ATP-binding protein [Aeromicrobium sp. CFBP 8757]|uniref:sugar ABC transporter ATP-binding protein n=1 Tax=Aeromicrobium sp. CFBP 8757 TaxID=2775288 RepID=UPI00177CA4DE|nr:sugar ABC transporter ATP-binding protein [Aeromicrobium sp. CFBP 8757]MBD8605534.1 sugar ABC transporter ATP-binding protein [Aeromicrobium sp. CFBP 8757]